MWGRSAKDLIYNRAINLIKSMDANGFVSEQDLAEEWLDASITFVWFLKIKYFNLIITFCYFD